MPEKNMIDREIIDTVKTDIDLVSLIESRGIKLKKNGRGHVGLCPFHEDKTPSLSVTPEANLWQCFGCGAGGDVIRFVELFDKLNFPEAVNSLTDNKQKFKKAEPPAVKEEKLSVKEKKLFARVVEYYQHTFAEDNFALEYLKNRGITENQSSIDFGAGYANGTLLQILPEDDEIIKSLKSIGILNQKGNEVFYDCVVFPLLNDKGTAVSLYGRRINENATIKHQYLKGIRGGVINSHAVKRSQTIILTESVIDALSLYDQGFKNVIPLYGVNGLTDDHFFFFNRIKEAYIVFDADEPGQNGALRLEEQLKDLDPRGKEIITHIVNLPVKDVNIFFNRHTPEEFETLLKHANPKSLEQSEIIKKREQTLYKKTEYGFIVGFEKRRYQVKGIQRSATQLKATVKVSENLESNKPFELTTIDLYSSRSRTWFAKLCASLFSASEELIKEDVGKLLNLVETYKPEEKKQEKNEATPEEKESALKFLNNPDMFTEILTDLETTGIIGEETNKLIGYLAAISRKLDDPLSVLVQSRSAAGKSTLQDAVLSLVPPEDYVKYTRITDQALFYKGEDSLVNKILAIEEEVGMGGAAYSIRNIQSAKKITVAATGKDPGTGKMRTEEYTVNGPIAVMITTTSADLEGETSSRFLFVTIDESSGMTEAIHTKQRESETLEGLINKTKTESIIKKHHTAQRMLKPIAIVNPFTKYLSYPSGSLRTRRDHKKYLGLIKAIACLHQFQRKTKKTKVDGKQVEYIEVTLEDIEQANKLASEVLGQCLDDLARPSRNLLKAIFAMVQEMAFKNDEAPEEEFFFNRRMIREYINWTDWQIRAHIKQLEELEYLYARTGSRGKEYAYALNYKGQENDEERFY
ncbi:MAG: toprim domain-containing protein, partial [Desulfobacterales bacterium]|nr:toprim domain-containing protein [Desulfobacterales bacterium]